MSKLRVLDLFSGIGGFALGLERTGGFETVAFCEIDPFCQQVLRKHWPDVPIYDDVRTIDANGLGTVDIVTGGYPCQPFSQAGKRLGEKDDRHLWPEMFRLVEALRPAWVIGENVNGHVSMGLDQVLSDLEGAGYAVQPFVIPACAVDAPHRRDRVWIIASRNDADADSKRPHRTGVDQLGKGEPVDGEVCEPRQVREVLAGRGDAGDGKASDVANAGIGQCGEPGGGKDEQSGRTKTIGAGETLANDDSAKRIWKRAGRMGANAKTNGWDNARWVRKMDITSQWLPEPPVGRVAHGIPRRVDRLRSLGNAVVPQIPELIGNAILEAERVSL